MVYATTYFFASTSAGLFSLKEIIILGFFSSLENKSLWSVIFSHSVNDYFTAGRYEIEALALLEELFKTHSTVVMAGGSGLYIDALCNGLDDFPPADQNLRRRLTLKAEKEGVESLAALLREIDPLSYETIEISNRQRVIRAVEVTLQTGRKFSDWKSHAVKPLTARSSRLSEMRSRLPR